jgi:hypothetical protein
MQKFGFAIDDSDTRIATNVMLGSSALRFDTISWLYLGDAPVHQPFAPSARTGSVYKPIRDAWRLDGGTPF